MIIWGSGGDRLERDYHSRMDCRYCQAQRNFGITLVYRYFHLYFFFGVVTKKEYYLVCSFCQQGWQLDAKEAEARVNSLPIPVTRRFGLAALVAVFGCLFFASMLLQSLGLMK